MTIALVSKFRRPVGAAVRLGGGSSAPECRRAEQLLDRLRRDRPRRGAVTGLASATLVSTAGDGGRKAAWTVRTRRVSVGAGSPPARERDLEALVGVLDLVRHRPVEIDDDTADRVGRAPELPRPHALDAPCPTVTWLLVQSAHRALQVDHQPSAGSRDRGWCRPADPSPSASPPALRSRLGPRSRCAAPRRPQSSWAPRRVPTAARSPPRARRSRLVERCWPARARSARPGTTCRTYLIGLLLALAGPAFSLRPGMA